MIARSRLVGNFLSHCAVHRQLTRVVGLNQSVRLQSTNGDPDKNFTLKLPPDGISVEHSNVNHESNCRPHYVAGDRITNDISVEEQEIDERERKIVIGGLSNDISQDAIRAYFSQFGQIELYSPFCGDKAAYITFASPNAVQQVLNCGPYYLVGDRITNDIDIKASKSMTPPKDELTLSLGTLPTITTSDSIRELVSK
ncbi:RNA recognition motif domain-containing protein [Ditylenchus destructor]|nr:RNA recognition motif domain-containing protein [Ditylenchus destructor]